MERVYFLDLPTMLEYLQGRSCTLSTPISLPGRSGQGFLFCEHGVVRGSLIRWSDGTHLQGEEAYTYLQRGTQWQVQLESVLQPSLQRQPEHMTLQSPAPSLPSASFLPAPRQKRALDPSLLSGLNARQSLMVRTIFAKINGQRTSEQIKEQLNLSPQVVDEVLAYLFSLGIIE